MDALHTGPDGYDLRMTWPERQLWLRDKNLRNARLRKLADTELPYLNDFVERCGGRMPDTLDELERSPWGVALERFWNQMFQHNRNLSYELAQMQLHADVRWAYAVEWWEYEGRRTYLLDPTTAHALLHTNVDDYPTAEFKLPLRSFFIRIPREMGWKFELSEQAGIILSQPLDTHPEPTQEMDGFHVTADMVGGRIYNLEIVAAGRSTFGPMGDHMMWGEVPFAQHATLGEVINQMLVPSSRAASMTEAGFNKKILHLVLGTILYVTSLHPELRAVEPPHHGTLAKAMKDGGAKAARAAERSRYCITYVGGPRSGFKTAGGEGDVDGMTRKPPRPHVRAGHMRHIWLGARGTDGRHSEVRWIQPVMVGSWDRIAAYEAEKGYRFVMHKTRPAEVVHPEEAAS